MSQRASSPRDVWARAERAARRSSLEDDLERQLRPYGLPGWEREYQFALPERQWRADFAWPAHRVLVEVEGITYAGGRHQRPAGFDEDARKYAWAQERGWTVVRVSAAMVRDGTGAQHVVNMLYRAARATVNRP